MNLVEYSKLRASYRLEVPEYFNFGFDVVDRWATENADSLALLWVGPKDQRRISYGELSRRSNQLVNALYSRGLSRGDQVLVILPSLPQWWETIIGLTKAGLIAIPGTTQLTAKDIAYRINAAEVDAIITDISGAEKVDQISDNVSSLTAKIMVDEQHRQGWIGYEQMVSEASDELSPLQSSSDEPAMIYFTSGTTGMPKMVVHSHSSYGIGHQITTRFWLDLRRTDLHWNISDTGWAKTAYSGLFSPMIAGCALFVRHSPGRFEAPDVLQQLTEHPITTLCAPPTVYRMLNQQDLGGFHPSDLRRCMAAGEPLHPAVLQSWLSATGLTIHEGYGQTETVILCASLPDCEVKPGSMGLAPPGIDLAVLGTDGQPLPSGVTGEIAVRVAPDRPVGLFQEYWHQPEATNRCYRGDWYLTGDCAYTDDDGYFWFVARADDIITSAAYRIGPFEVESALMEHPAVAEVAVIGKPDPERTEIVKAFVVLAEGFQPTEELKQDLQNHVKRTTAPYKYPREIEFLDELPKTVSGKVRRVELRQRA